MRGRDAQVASAQAGTPQIVMRAAFGEVVLAKASKGKANIIFLREFCNVGSAGRYVRNIFAKNAVLKVAHLMVEAFVLLGSHALRPIPLKLSSGLGSRRGRWPV